MPDSSVPLKWITEINATAFVDHEQGIQKAYALSIKTLSSASTTLEEIVFVLNEEQAEKLRDSLSGLLG